MGAMVFITIRESSHRECIMVTTNLRIYALTHFVYAPQKNEVFLTMYLFIESQ
jgi:hypothetical protein